MSVDSHLTSHTKHQHSLAAHFHVVSHALLNSDNFGALAELQRLRTYFSQRGMSVNPSISFRWKQSAPMSPLHPVSLRPQVIAVAKHLFISLKVDEIPTLSITFS